MFQAFGKISDEEIGGGSITCSTQFPLSQIMRILYLSQEIIILELSVKSPSVAPLISSAFTPYPLFQWYPQSKEILLNLGMKCWNSAFNAQGSRVIIVVAQVGPVKIYVAAVEALRKRAKTGWTSVYHQNWWKKLVWIPVIFPFVKFSCPVMGLMSYYAKTGRSRPLLLAWLYRQLMWLLVIPNTYLYGQSAQIFLSLKSWEVLSFPGDDVIAS
jgi:hypothetical protein